MHSETSQVIQGHKMSLKVSHNRRHFNAGKSRSNVVENLQQQLLLVCSSDDKKYFCVCKSYELMLHLYKSLTTQRQQTQDNKFTTQRKWKFLYFRCVVNLLCCRCVVAPYLLFNQQVTK